MGAVSTWSVQNNHCLFCTGAHIKIVLPDPAVFGNLISTATDVKAGCDLRIPVNQSKECGPSTQEMKSACSINQFPVSGARSFKAFS